MSLVNIATACPICGRKTEIQVFAEDYAKWQNGEMVQSAFPYLSNDQREMLITGICPICWVNLFGDD